MTDLKIFQDGSHEIEDNYTEKHTKSLKSIRPNSRSNNQTFYSKSRKQNIEFWGSFEFIFKIRFN